MKFQYVAYTTQDGVLKGKIEAPNEVEARGAIALQGYKVLSVDPARRLPGLEELFPTFFKAGTGELVRFSRHLATMVRGGSSMQRALQMIQTETGNRVMRHTIEGLRETLDRGGSLTAGLALYPRVFDARYISVVEVGEFTGSLAPALEQLSESLEVEQDAMRRAKQTLLMPAFTMSASLIMLVLMMTVLLPPLLETFEDMDSEIPGVTKAAIASVSIVKGNLIAIILGVGALIAVFWSLGRVPVAKAWMHRLQLRLPLIGPLVLAKELSRFSRTAAMLLPSGVPLARALPLAKSGCKNVALNQAFTAGEESLLAGHGLAEALARYPVLPRMWVELVSIGEESNSLGRTMDELANSYEKELEARIGSIVTLMEPMSTLAVGAVVLFMALSMLLPIYSGLDSVGQY